MGRASELEVVVGRLGAVPGPWAPLRADGVRWQAAVPLERVEEMGERPVMREEPGYEARRCQGTLNGPRPSTEKAP